jgi:hypothetical protein
MLFQRALLIYEEMVSVDEADGNPFLFEDKMRLSL